MQVFYFGQDSLCPEYDISFNNIKRVVFQEPQNPEKVICGRSTIFLIDDKGSVWGLGQTLNGQLGIETDTIQKQPIEIAFKTKIKKVACGQNQVMAINQEQSHLYIWGDNSLCQLPLDQSSMTIKPTEVSKKLSQLINNEPESPELRKKKTPCFFEFICCSTEHSFLIFNGQLFGFGKDHKNRLGFKNQNQLNEEMYSFKKPTIYRISKIPISVIGISTSISHTLAWNKEGQLFSWGDATDGKLGRNIDQLGYIGVQEAGLVDIDEEISMAACGENYSIALTKKGIIYTWGKGKYSKNISEEKIPSIMDCMKPKQIEPIYDRKKLAFRKFADRLKVLDQPLKFVKILAGPTHYAALDLFGNLFTWGDCTGGCLGQEDIDLFNPKHVESLYQYKVVDVGLGYQFTVVLTLHGGMSEDMKQFWANHQLQLRSECSIIKQYLKDKTTLEEEQMKSQTHLNIENPINYGVSTINNGYHSVKFSGQSVRIIPEEDSRQFYVGKNKNFKLKNRTLKLSYGSASTMLDKSKQSTKTSNFTKNQMKQKKDRHLTFKESLKQILRKSDLKDSIKSNHLTPKNSRQNEDITAIPHQFHKLSYDGTQYEIKFDYVSDIIDLKERTDPINLPFLNEPKHTIKQSQSESNLKIHNYEPQKDLLKFQYIELVRNGNEDKHIQFLLTDHLESIHDASKFKRKSQKKPKGEILYDQFKSIQKKAQSSIDRFYENVMSSEEEKLILSKVQDSIIKSEKIIAKPKAIQSIIDPNYKIITKEEYLQSLNDQQKEREEKRSEVIKKKFLNQLNKQRLIIEKIELKSLEYKEKKRRQNLHNLQLVQMIKLSLVYLNQEQILYQLLQFTIKGLDLKRNMFKQHMKARVIQNTFRKIKVKKQVTSITIRQRGLLRNLIFNFRIRFSIKRKNKHVRRLFLIFIKNELVKKIASNATIMNTAIYNLQTFTRWFNKCFYTMLSTISVKWDNYFFMQSFKIDQNQLQLLKGAHHNDMDSQLQTPKQTSLDSQKQYQGKVRQLLDQITVKIVKLSALQRQLKLKPQLLLHTYELKYSILKNIEKINKSNIQQPTQIVFEEDKIEAKLLPGPDTLLIYTRHATLIELPVYWRLKFDSQFNSLIQDRMEAEEIRIKNDIIKHYLRAQRKQFAKQMSEYYEQLGKFKDENMPEINKYRARLLLKTKVEDLVALQKKEDQEYNMLMRKNKKLNDEDEKNNEEVTANLIKKPKKGLSSLNFITKDHLPFGNLILKISEHMYGIENKPIFKIKLSQESWKKMVTKYQQEFKICYDRTITQVRVQMSNNARNAKQRSLSPT